MMKYLFKIKENPHHLLLFISMALLFVIVLHPIDNIDLQDKTMFGISLSIIIWLVPLFLLSFWLIYILAKRILYSLTFSRIHVVITAFSAIFILASLYIGNNPSQSTIEKHELVGNIMQILFIVFICAQFLFPVNFLAGLFRKSAK